MDAVKSLVLSSSVFDMFRNQRLDPEYQEKFWRHSLVTGLAGRMLTNRHSAFRGLDAEISFCAGLLHDIGKVIICCFMPEDHKRITQYQAKQNCSDYEAEEQMIGFAHPLVGQLLAGNWKLPKAIQNAIAYHHFPQENKGAEDKYPVIIHIANHLAIRSFESEFLPSPGWDILQPEIKEEMQLTDDVPAAFSDQLFEEYSKASTFIQMAVGDTAAA